MAKKRRGGAATSDADVVDTSTDADASPSSTLIKAQSSLALALTVSSASYIPSTVLQSLALAYALLVLPGRPASFTDVNQLCGPLIEDTVSAMLAVIAGTALAQTYFGGQARRWYTAARKSTDTKDTETLLRRGAATVHALLHTVLFSLVIFALLILLGASIHRKIIQTALLAVYLALLMFTPSILVLSSPFPLPPSEDVARVQQDWIRCFVEARPTDDVELSLVASAVGTLLGACMGALPIPLDWEQPWQTWPLTVMLGACAGNAVGQLAGLALLSTLWISQDLKGKRRLDYSSINANAKDE